MILCLNAFSIFQFNGSIFPNSESFKNFLVLILEIFAKIKCVYVSNVSMRLVSLLNGLQISIYEFL